MFEAEIWGAFNCLNVPLPLPEKEALPMDALHVLSVCHRCFGRASSIVGPV